MIARFDDSRDDRRMEQRVPLSAKVILDAPSGRCTGLSSDVSCGGIFVALDEPLAVGTEVTIAILIKEEDDERTLRLHGIVRWKRDAEEDDDYPSGVGIAFARVGPEELDALTKTCARRAPYFYEFGR